MDSIECVVVGAGVIGLAIARALTSRGYETIIVETERHIGSGISSRSSEVIHAGIYYPPASLKARFCIEGRQQLYAYCEARNIPHRRCGKLIVATTDVQITELERIRSLAEAAGVNDILQMTASEVRQIEPELHCVGALNSPSTGIIDSHAYMLSLGADAEAGGALFALDTKLTGMYLGQQGVHMSFQGEAAPSLQARLVVNAAGLEAQSVAKAMTELSPDHIPPIYYAKGNYFRLIGRSPFSHLIYPAPEPGGLGTHLTLDMDGRARFGPDVQWIEAPEYNVDPKRSRAFYRNVRAYWPGLPDGALSPDYAGIRPKLNGPGEPASDFIISGPSDHGIDGLINLFGIESPGITASLAIADHVGLMAYNFMD